MTVCLQSIFALAACCEKFVSDCRSTSWAVQHNVAATSITQFAVRVVAVDRDVATTSQLLGLREGMSALQPPYCGAHMHATTIA
eukprot:3759556-Amphidinium_carterae.1